MFGTNPIRKAEKVDTGTLAVQKIFYTIQGEGPYSGIPAVFIRLAGCNLRCWFCDTEFESNIENRISLDEIFAGVRNIIHGMKRPPRLAVITGGEPLRQPITALCVGLIRSGFTVQLETAGTLPIPGDILPYIICQQVSVVVSPKTGTLHESVVTFADYYKYIIQAGAAHPDDGLPVYETQRDGCKLALARPPSDLPCDSIYLQPMDENDDDKNEANEQECVRLCMEYGYRLCLQVHKIVGLE